MQLVPIAGKVQLVPSAGKRATRAKRGKTHVGHVTVVFGFPSDWLEIHASGVLDFLVDRTALWVGGLRKAGINFRHIE